MFSGNYLRDRFFSGMDRSIPLVGLIRIASPVFPTALFALVYQWEAGFLQGVALSPGYLPLARGFPGIRSFIKLYLAAIRSLQGVSGGIQISPFADVPFPRISASPVSSSLLAVPMMGGGILFQ
jgi:hypothetical protein